MTFAAADLDRIDWGKGDGLVPAIVQHATSGSVLMLGYMDRAALSATLARGRVVFFSRSRQRLWEKGETSGNFLQLVDVHADCDADTLLVSALPAGPVCHTGSASCFGDAPTAVVALPGIAAPLAASAPLGFLQQLEELIAQRIADAPESSYTARLYASGVRRVAQKVGEEGLEVALAGAGEPDAALVAESADLVYHLLVLLRSRGLPLATVIDELRRRHDALGLVRGKGIKPLRNKP
jgi:phosphoribosyl-ATP pyrophosphohydrolase/phosphoribosyl-AMP cyclohydrolase